MQLCTTGVSIHARTSQYTFYHITWHLLLAVVMDNIQRFPKFLQQPTKTEVRSHVTLRMVIGYLLRLCFEIYCSALFPFNTRCYKDFRCHSDICFPGYRVSRTHIPRDACFPAHISLTHQWPTSHSDICFPRDACFP